MTMKQGDIVLVPFPFTDLSSAKTRPALVLSKKNAGKDCIVAAITSQKGGGHRLTNSNLSKGKLPITSYVRYSKVATLHKDLIRKNVASVEKCSLNVILEKFVGLF